MMREVSPCNGLDRCRASTLTRRFYCPRQADLCRCLSNSMAGNWITLSTDTLRIYFDLCIIKYFLNFISPHDDMQAKINALLANYPAIDVAAIDFLYPFWLEERAVVAMKQLYKAGEDGKQRFRARFG